jgi:hypothetical protein
MNSQPNPLGPFVYLLYEYGIFFFDNIHNILESLLHEYSLLLSRWYSICDHILQRLFIARLQLYLQEFYSLVFGVLEKLQETPFVLGVQGEAANETR